MAKKKAPEVKEEIKAETEAKEVKEEAEVKNTGKPHYKHRLEAINEIAAANRSDRDEALQENEPSVEEDIEAANREARAAEVTEVKEEPKVETKVETKRKFIVDGKELELTDQEITEHVQKSATADTRLREAARLLEDVKRQRAPTPTDASPASPTRQNAPSNGPLPTTSVDAGQADNLVGELTAAIVRGDQEEISQNLRKVFGTRQATVVAQQAQGLDPVQVQGLVQETIAFNQAKQLLEDPPEKGGFSDIYSDPMLKVQFERREVELRDAGDKRPYRELYTAIGTEIRKWRDDLVSKHIPKTGLEDRDSHKRQAGVVRGAGARLPSAPEVQPKTHEQKLEQMRRARGLN